jgi:hypothetical protein
MGRFIDSIKKELHAMQSDYHLFSFAYHACTDRDIESMKYHLERMKGASVESGDSNCPVGVEIIRKGNVERIIEGYDDIRKYLDAI